MKGIQRKIIAFLLMLTLLAALTPVEAITKAPSAETSPAYTVEFTYNDRQYVLQGGGAVRLHDVLAYIGITGEASSWQVSNAKLFDVVLESEAGPGGALSPGLFPISPLTARNGWTLPCRTASPIALL